MSDRPKMMFLLGFGLLLISPSPAGAQPAPLPPPPQPLIADTTWAALDVSKAIDRAIEESSDSAGLREKAVRRISECSLVYGGLSTLTVNLDARKSYVQAQSATMEVELAISKPLQPARKLEIEDAAYRTVALMLRTVKTQGTKEVAPLLKSCRALNDVKDVKNALLELSQQQQ